MAKFQIGDLVCLKSGSCALTIEAIVTGGCGDKTWTAIQCVWFDDDDKIYRDNIDDRCLEFYDEYVEQN